MARILLIDDDEIGRDALARRLLRKGHQVDHSGEGDEGIEMARSNVPDLVVIGMSLTLPDGWDVTRKIKQAEPTREVPVIAILEEDSVNQREKAVDAGCDDYLARPVHLEQMVERIQGLLTRPSAT